LGAQLPRLARQEAIGVPQDPARRRVFPQRSPEDGLVDWSWPAQRVYDFVRAQTRPYPGAFTRFRGEQLTLWRVEPLEDRSLSVGKPGTLRCQFGDAQEASITCGDRRQVGLSEVEWKGVTLSGREFSRCIVAEGGRELAEQLG
jgi:methionyl-tRNA formyltransferase